MTNRNVERGKSAEKRIVAALSRITGLSFARTPGSGSGHTWKFFEGKKVRGDIVCLDDPAFPFLIESKKAGKFAWDLLFTDKPPADFEAWWKQARDSATDDDKLAALVVSRNQGPMVIFSAAVAWVAVGMNVKYAHARLIWRNKQLLVTTVEDFATAYAERSKR